MLVKFGKRTILIGVHDPYPFTCPNCKELGTVDFVITCEYFHIYYIPMFPYEKDGFGSCSNCNFKASSLKFSKHSADIFKEIKRSYRYPYYTYIGISLFLTPIIIGILFLVF